MQCGDVGIHCFDLPNRNGFVRRSEASRRALLRLVALPRPRPKEGLAMRARDSAARCRISARQLPSPPRAPRPRTPFRAAPDRAASSVATSIVKSVACCGIPGRSLSVPLIHIVIPAACCGMPGSPLSSLLIHIVKSVAFCGILGSQLTRLARHVPAVTSLRRTTFARSPHKRDAYSVDQLASPACDILTTTNNRFALWSVRWESGKSWRHSGPPQLVPRDDAQLQRAVSLAPGCAMPPGSTSTWPCRCAEYRACGCQGCLLPDWTDRAF